MLLNKNQNKFEYLTSIRGIAALIVLLSHIVQVYWLRYEEFPYWIHSVSSMSSLFAVKVFFVLSGFLIAHSIEENSKRNAGIFDLKSYIAARFARIYPPFLYSLIVSIVVFSILYAFNMPGIYSPMRFPGDIYSARDFVKLPMAELVLSLVMLQGLLDINGPLWSLYIEVKLYLIFVFFYLIFIGQHKVFYIVSLLLLIYLSLRFNPEFLRFTVIWISGCITYYLFGDPARVLKKKLLACSGLVMAIVFYDTAGHFVKMPMVFHDRSFIFSELLLCVFIAAIILLFKVRIPFAHKAGLFSYSLYVTHFPVLILIQSTLVFFGCSSLFISLIVSVFAFLAALLVSFFGGLVETKKGIIQTRILELYMKATQLIKF